MAKKKFEFKRYNYISENKYFIMNKNNHDWWDSSEYTWDVHTWTPTTITTTNVPTITTTTAGAESTRYYTWTALSNAMNNITYTDFPSISERTHTITTTLTDGWRML